MNSPVFSLPRALSMPFQATSLMLVALTSVLLTLFRAFEPQLSLPAWVGTYLMCIWISRYAFALLDTAANGETRSPVASVEMLGPFADPRSWVLPALAALAALAVALLPPGLRLPGTVLALLVLPIPVAATALTDRLVDAVDPRAWWQLRGLGMAYPMLLLTLGGCAALGWLTWQVPLPRLLQFAVIQLLYLSAFVMLGAGLHLRRHALAFSPRHSAERTQERRDAEHAQALQAMIDDSYKSTRARRPQDLAVTLDRWFAQTPSAAQHADAMALMQAATQWSDPAGAKLLRHLLVERLGALPNLALAAQLAEEMLRTEPGFAPQSSALTASLVGYARQTGRRRLAATLLHNALQRCPETERAALLTLQQEAGT
ncbi:MAG: hypothetical protein QM696_08885 [Steroidobacteraceae bacterium]